MPSWFLFVMFFALIAIGTPIAISLGLSAFTMILLSGMPIGIISSVMYSAISRYTMLALPFFILAGVVMEYAGISRRLVDCARMLVGHRRGGMIIVSIVCCCFFGAISGSGTACVAALGAVLIPAMANDGYDRGMCTAMISMAGGIGLIIPPSTQFVLYGVVAKVSILELFISGFLPGILLGVFLCAAGFWSIRNAKDIAVFEKPSRKKQFIALKDAFWGLLSPIIILGGIYSGIFSPTEAAGISVVYSMAVGLFIYKEMKLKDLWPLILRAGISTAMIMFIVAFANVFAWYLTTSFLAADIASAFMTISTNKNILLLMMVIVFLIAGCFIDPTSMIYIFVPIMLPICEQVGIDLIHFGMVSTVAVVIGLVTPPVGNNLYMGASVGNVPPGEVAKKSLPFLVAATLALLMIMYIPQITLFLPNLLKK